MIGTHRGVRLAILLIASLLLAGVLACELGRGDPPTVQITFPPTGRQVLVGTEVPVYSVSQDDRGVSRVELWSRAQVVETTNASGTERTFIAVQYWTASEVGVFNVGVRAYDSNGLVSQPVIITIQVVGTAAEITDPLPEAPPPPTQPPAEQPPEEPPTEPEEPSGPEEPEAEPGEPVDLEITNLTLSNLNPEPGVPIAVGVTILNSGGTAAEDFRWAWDPGTGEDPVHSEPIEYLAPGDDVVDEMSYTYQQEGDYAGHAWADSYDAYDEPDETNNVRWEGGAVSVTAAIEEEGEPVDLEITNLTLSNLNPEPGVPIAVGVTILNSGGTAAEDFRWAWDPGTGEDPIHSEPIEYLAPGDDVVDEMSYTYQQQGDYAGHAWADSYDAYDEPDETNNVRWEGGAVSVTAAIQEQAGAVVEYHDYQEGAWATFSVRNTGNVQLESMEASVRDFDTNQQLAAVQSNRPFLGGWSGRPPENPSVEPGDGSALAVNIGSWASGTRCLAEFTFYSEDNAGGVDTGTITVQFVIDGGVQPQAEAVVEYHDYQDDAWATFSVQNTGDLALESMQVSVRLVATNEQLAAVQSNRPFLGGWSGRPPGNPRLEPGQGAVLAINIGSQVDGAWCIGEFIFFSEDGGGGVATETITERFTI